MPIAACNSLNINPLISAAKVMGINAVMTQSTRAKPLFDSAAIPPKTIPVGKRSPHIA
jgi:hypothetical protein